jgi:hypothetical protein
VNESDNDIIMPGGDIYFGQMVKWWDDNYGAAIQGPLPLREFLPAALREDILREKTQEELIELITAMAADWQWLNRIYNDRAMAWGWCGDYERNQVSYNAHFRIMQLHGRRSGLRNHKGGHPPLIYNDDGEGVAINAEHNQRTL